MKKIILSATALLGISSLIFGAWWFFRPQADYQFVPPFPALNPAFTNYEFDAEEGTKIEYPTGSTITIPPNALVDDAGNAVKGKVKLQYRELHSVLDVLTSGVPLSYDSAGAQYHLQTAGMFDIQASQGESPLQIAEGKNIDVRFASFQQGDQYSFYQFDKKKGTWVFEKPAVSEPNTEKIRLKDSLENIKLLNPQNLMVFHFGEALDIFFNYDYEKVGNKLLQTNFRNLLKSYDLQVYEKMRMREPVSYKNATYPAFSLVWERLDGVPFPAWVQDLNRKYEDLGYTDSSKITHLYKNTEYIKTFQLLADASYQIQILEKVTARQENPIVKIDTTWAKETKNTRKKSTSVIKRKVAKITHIHTSESTIFKEYITRKFSFRAKPHLRLSEFLRSKPSQNSAEYEQAMQNIGEQSAKIEQLADVFRQSKISKFGTYNYDFMLKLNDAVLVKADFEFGQTQPDLVYYISAKNKAVIKYPVADWDKVRLQKDETARIFAIMPDLTIAYYDPQTLQKLDLEKLRQAGKHHFVLKNDKTAVQNQNDLKNALSMQ